MILLKKYFFQFRKKNSPNLNRKNIIPLMLDNDLHFIAKLDFSSNLNLVLTLN
jgi:hypothetical protein